jgi:hypothetical protein
MLALLLCVEQVTASDAVRKIAANGTIFKAELNDGRKLNSIDLVGTELDIRISKKTMRLRIDSVERDSTADAIWLHGFSVKQPTGSWKKLCRPGPDGRALGFPLAGKTRDNGTLDTTDQNLFELTCTSGVQAKCVRYGYLPWATAPDGLSLLPAFNACVLMLRADYAGNNAPTTRDGAKIDVADRWNIQSLDINDENFEAGWDAGGALCVHHPRIGENISLEQLEAKTPRLKGRTGTICTPEFARKLGALIFNRSKN